MNFEEYTLPLLGVLGRPADPLAALDGLDCSMVIDDHDMSDDWNISARVGRRDAPQAVVERRAIVGGLTSYWVYQWLGNLSPRELAENDVYQAVRSEDDASPILRDFAAEADQEVESARWSYCRDLGRTRLLVLDSRAGRVLEEGRRSIFDDDEWDWIAEHASGDFDHLADRHVGPLPARARASTTSRRGARRSATAPGGGSAARLAESARRALDFDHWGAFRMSFERLTKLIEEVGSGERGKAAGVDRRPLRRRPPRLPRRRRLPARRRRAERRLPGDLLALPQPARPSASAA